MVCRLKRKYKSMVCPYCNTKAKFISNELVYGKRYGKSFMCYYCKDCNAYVGVHENDPKRPLGTMANKELRKARIIAHANFDRIWKSGLMKILDAYKKLAQLLGVNEIHIGESDLSMCRKIIELCPEMY